MCKIVACRFHHDTERIASQVTQIACLDGDQSMSPGWRPFVKKNTNNKASKLDILVNAPSLNLQWLYSGLPLVEQVHQQTEFQLKSVPQYLKQPLVFVL